MDDLLADFLTETHEGLAALDAALVRLERTPDDQPTLSEVFRLVHTIKGTCGFLGLSRLEAVAHAAENVLGTLPRRRAAGHAGRHQPDPRRARPHQGDRRRARGDRRRAGRATTPR